MSELSLKEEESPLINTPSADNFYGDDNDQGDNDDEDINAEEEEENSEEHESEEHEPEEMQEYLDTIDLNQQEEEDEPYVFSIFDILDKPRILPDPVDLTFEHLKKIEEELGLIKLCWPKIESLEFPKAYLENVQKEKVLLAYTENFRRQFFLQFPNRKPLFLAAVNECGMQKMVCTTIRPTLVPFPEIDTWQKCASFAADYFEYECLEEPTLLPRRLFSPPTIVQRQKGQSFEIATALCSLLIGFGYNAYVVSGYAIKDITEKIMLRIDCPFVEVAEDEEVEEEVEKVSKYTVTPPRDLRSKLLLMMEGREKEKIRLEEEKAAEIERNRMLDEEKRPFDSLEGQRIHGWILLKEGKDVEAPFFLEPTTGFRYELDSAMYCGIESLWNDKNYWINMQQCTEGMSCIEYDLTDVEKWEHLLIGEPIGSRKYKTEDIGEEDDGGKEMYDEKHLDMPLSWSLPISMPHEALATRFPNGSKTSHYKRTIVEEFAPYVMSDGLVTRIASYKDFDCTVLVKIEERYKNRSDKLYKNVYDLETNIVEDYFHPGREDGCIKHTHYHNKESIDDFRILDFNNRFDGLIKIETDLKHLTEHYANRDDFQNNRHTDYGPKTDGRRRDIIKITEKYDRNEKLHYADDINIREFNFPTREINIKYHYGPSQITYSTRYFQKPPPAEIGEVETFHPELTFGYQSDLEAKPPTLVQLYYLLEKQMKDEERLTDDVRIMEKQIKDFLFLRNRELAFPSLEVSLFNREQNIENRMAMLQEEAEAKLQMDKEMEEETDYFGPYIAKFDNPHMLSSFQIRQLKLQCLTDFKEMLVNRANNIQKKFEKFSEILQQKQAWYNQNYDDLTEFDIQSTMQEMSYIIFYMHTLELRLIRHRDLSASRYEAVAQYLEDHKFN